jgi:hypothetical protein
MCTVVSGDVVVVLRATVVVALVVLGFAVVDGAACDFDDEQLARPATANHSIQTAPLPRARRTEKRYAAERRRRGDGVEAVDVVDCADVAP